MISKLKFIHLDDVESTNNYAAKLLNEKNIKSGTVILADYQSGGKGQRGASWQSEWGKNLLYSLYIEHDNLSYENQRELNFAVALAVKETIDGFVDQVKIKWPNDIYVQDRKIAGILIENQLKGSYIKSSIIGVGLNLNQVEFQYLNATSLVLETGVETNLMDVASRLSKSLTKECEMIRFHHLDLERRYLSSLYRLNESGLFRDDSGQFDGIIRGIDKEGKLIVERKSETKSYNLKEIIFV